MQTNGRRRSTIACFSLNVDDLTSRLRGVYLHRLRAIMGFYGRHLWCAEPVFSSDDDGMLPVYTSGRHARSDKQLLQGVVRRMLNINGFEINCFSDSSESFDRPFLSLQRPIASTVSSADAAHAIYPGLPLTPMWPFLDP